MKATMKCLVLAAEVFKLEEGIRRTIKYLSGIT
jgi:hypothetical protein